MSLDHIGGYILIPRTTGRSFTDVIDLTLQMLGVSQSGQRVAPRKVGVYEPGEGLSPWREVAGPSEHGLAELERKGAGVVLLSMLGFGGVVGFDADRSGYFTVYVSVREEDFVEPPGDPASVYALAERWVTLCEASEAEFGYFSQTPVEATVEYRDESVVPQLLRGEPPGILDALYWIVYVGPALVAHLGEAVLRRQAYRAERLPSGALALRSTFVNNPRIFDLELLGEYLLKSVQRGAEVPGVVDLVHSLRQELEGRIAAVSDASDASDLLETEERESRAYLDQVRALWATARARAGLAGVDQSFALRGADGQETRVIVPIVAENGAEWVIPFTCRPSGVEDDVWTIPEMGLRARLRDLLAAAKRHPVAGQPPQVVAVFWKGVSQEVRDALTAVGAQVEIPAQTVPLIDA